MKKLIIAALAALLLTGCKAESEADKTLGLIVQSAEVAVEAAEDYLTDDLEINAASRTIDAQYVSVSEYADRIESQDDPNRASVRAVIISSSLLRLDIAMDPVLGPDTDDKIEEALDSLKDAISKAD